MMRTKAEKGIAFVNILLFICGIFSLPDIFLYVTFLIWIFALICLIKEKKILFQLHFM